MCEVSAEVCFCKRKPADEVRISDWSSDVCSSDLVADGGNQRNRRLGGGADDNFLVEGPEVLQRAAAARDDEQIRARQPPLLRQGVETADRRGDLLRGALALPQHRPYQHAARPAVGGRKSVVQGTGA